MKTLVWFRYDLRLADNPALAAACESASEIVLVYILDDELRPIGEAQRWWLHHSLLDLNKRLNHVNCSLILRRGRSTNIVLTLVNELGIEQVNWNRVYEPASIKHDTALKQTLNQQGVQVNSFNRSLLVEPGKVLNKSGGYFKVFTPFYKHVQLILPPPMITAKPQKWPKMIKTQSEDLKAWHLCPNKPDWAEGFACFVPGELGAQKALQQFIDEAVEDYAEDRDRPDLNNTSRLSAHLHFGELSPHQIWVALQGRGEMYSRQLVWRDFAYYLLYHFPNMATANFKPAFDSFTWKKNSKWLKAWQKGLTGYPLVDAGMRELWHTGWMHNRVRMVVASFLTKDLLQHWHHGLAWFDHTLLDADLANNAMGWQWVAGSGPDAAPYFRIFNPTTQAQKFDPDGVYIKRWIPELAKLPVKYIHEPVSAPGNVLSDAGIELGHDYPLPIVDHREMREQALALYKGIKQ